MERFNPFIQRVEGAKPAGMDEAEKPQPKEQDSASNTAGPKEEQIEQARAMAEKMIADNQRLFATFAKDISLTFKVSDAFFINFEKGEIHVDASWFAEKECSQEQILWACLHELSHFRDLVEDPVSMMANFDRIREQARKTGARIVQKYEAKFGAVLVRVGCATSAGAGVSRDLRGNSDGALGVCLSRDSST